MSPILNQSAINEAVNELEMFATRLVDEFWEENEERRYTSEAGTLGVRIRHEHGSRWFRIVWFWNRFGPKKAKNGRKQVYSDEISRGKGYQYNLNSFKRGRAWERALAKELEKRFSEIRKAQDQLKAAQQCVDNFARAARRGMVTIDPEILENLPKTKSQRRRQ